MKELKGTEVLENVQSYEYKPEFIFVTATYLPEIYQKLLKYKVRRYFIKPFDVDKLINELLNDKEIFETHRKLKYKNKKIFAKLKEYILK